MLKKCVSLEQTEPCRRLFVLRRRNEGNKCVRLMLDKIRHQNHLSWLINGTKCYITQIYGVIKYVSLTNVSEWANPGFSEHNYGHSES